MVPKNTYQLNKSAGSIDVDLTMVALLREQTAQTHHVVALKGN